MFGSNEEFESLVDLECIALQVTKNDKDARTIGLGIRFRLFIIRLIDARYLWGLHGYYVRV